MIDWQELVGADPAVLETISKLVRAGDEAPDDDGADGLGVQLGRALKALNLKNMGRLAAAQTAGRLPSRYLGCQALAVAAAAAANAVATPAIPVRPTQWKTDEAFAADFRVNTMTLATLNLIVTDDPIPASAFTSGISLPPQDAPIIGSGSNATVNVTNRAGAARDFDSMFTAIALAGPGTCG